MYLPEYTRTHGVNSKANTRDALLMSMLPYGLLLKTDAVSWYSGSNGSHKVSLLVEDGYIKEYHIRLKSKRYIYSVKFLGLTGDGIRYLAATYGEDYPWLRTVVDRMGVTGDEISFRCVGANATVEMLLRVQSANVFYNRAGARTIFDRLRDNPYQALCAMRVLTGNATMRGSAIHLLADALESWLRRNRPDCRMDDEHLGEYYDAFELRVPQNNPYTTDNYLCEREDFECDDARGRYRVSYIGALKVGKQVYLTYRSTRDGVKWNGNMVLSNRDIVSLQLERVGIVEPQIGSWTLPSIMLVDGVGNCMSGYRRAILDGRNMRSRADKVLGRGTRSLHLLPITWDAVYFMRAFVRITANAAAGHTFASLFKEAICEQWPDLFSPSPLDFSMDMRYKDLPCCFCGDLDVKRINPCRNWDADGSAYAIVCFDWQTDYFRYLCPQSAIIASIDVENMQVLEYRPCAE